MSEKSVDRRHIVFTGVPGSGKDYLLGRARVGGYLPSTTREIHVGQLLGAYLRNNIGNKDNIHAKSDLFDLDDALNAVLTAAAQEPETLIFNARIVHWHHEVGYSYRTPDGGNFRQCGGLAPPDGGLKSRIVRDTLKRLPKSPPTRNDRLLTLVVSLI